jgi:uncharacterized membrane protein (UPF0127 family)
MEALCRLSYSGGLRDDNNVLRRVLGPIALLLAFSCTSAANTPTPWCPASRVRFGAAAPELHVQLATDQASRTKGLKGVTGLLPGQGMAFIWDASTDGTFWMKDTLIPLSIAFVGTDDRIVTLTEMTPCEADPCPTYAADAPYTMAVEANAGWFTEHGISVGDRVRLVERFCS